MMHGLFFSSEAFSETCDLPLTASIQAVERAVDLLPLDAADPSAVKPDENVRWMRFELGLIREACSRGSEVEAVWRLEQIQSRMTMAAKPAPVRQPCRAAAHVGGKCPLTPDAHGGRRKTHIEATPSRSAATKSP